MNLISTVVIDGAAEVPEGGLPEEQNQVNMESLPYLPPEENMETEQEMWIVDSDEINVIVLFIFSCVICLL